MSFTPEERDKLEVYSAFCKDDTGNVLRTYSTDGRAVEVMINGCGIHCAKAGHETVP